MAGLPTTAQYRRVLQRLWPRLPDSHRRMLLAHYRAPDSTITTRKLQAAARYRESRGVNLQYGLLGDRLCREIPWTPPRGGQRSNSIASFSDTRLPGVECKWHMHQSLVRAIRELRLDVRP